MASSCRYCGERLYLGFHRQSLVMGLWAGSITGVVTFIVLWVINGG